MNKDAVEGITAPPPQKGVKCLEREQFTFYRSYYEAMKKLSKRDREQAIMAICKYSLEGVYDVNLLSQNARAAVNEIRPLMDAEIRMSIEGRRSAEYKLWRKAIFERDDYTCQVCGQRGVKLNAHHKKPYAYFPDLRYSIDNGITLCISCHQKVHRR